MYAIVEKGSHQFKVTPGQYVDVDLIDAEPGTKLALDRVLLYADGDEVQVGTPVVAGASVAATVVREIKGPKLIVFKYKPKTRYRRKTGHRQHYTRLRIDGISVGA